MSTVLGASFVCDPLTSAFPDRLTDDALWGEHAATQRLCRKASKETDRVGSMKEAGTDLIPVTPAISLQFSSMVYSRLPIAGILQYDFWNSTYLLHVPTLYDRSDG